MVLLSIRAFAVISLSCFAFSTAYSNGYSLREDRTDRVHGSERPFLVRYPDGTAERIVVKYDGYIKKKMWQTGESSKPLEGHPIDDRKCHWELSSWIQRTAYLIHRTGIQAPLENFERRFVVSWKDDRGPDKPYEIFYHRTCGDSRGAYDEQVNGLTRNLIGSFSSRLNEDRTEAIAHLRRLLGATEVVPQ
jgi:hypothetical protein